MHRQLIIFIIGIVSSAIVLILAIWYIAVFKEQELPEWREVATPSSQDETAYSTSLSQADWMMYWNEEYGFEVRYPRGWEIDDGIPLTTSVYEFAVAFDRTATQSIEEWTEASPGEFSIIIFQKPYPPQQLNREGIIGPDKRYYEQIQFLGFSANKNYDTVEVDLGSPTASIDFNHNDYGWLISYYIDDTSGNHDPIYDQILSTFRFID